MNERSSPQSVPILQQSQYLVDSLNIPSLIHCRLVWIVVATSTAHPDCLVIPIQGCAEAVKTIKCQSSRDRIDLDQSKDPFDEKRGI
jgi:hypothetical protein